MSAVALDGVLRRYAWGSTTAIPQLLGEEPDGRPAAELWFGAHPDDPSGLVEQGGTLDELIARDPAAALGPRVAQRFGERLPFLLKILAAGQALSIQVHPTVEQARAGFAREDAAGVPRDDPARNYRDANHKPELICALTAFEGLCGFRPVAATLRLVTALGAPELGFLRDALSGPQPLRAAFTAVLSHPEPATLAGVVAERLNTVGSAYYRELRGVRLAAQDFPGDVGVVLALLLNHVRLEPGEAMFLPAGNVHAYLRGLGVEIMASSDNVLRCGLTGKHIDVPELLAITDFTALDDPLLHPVGGSFVVPVPDFRLTRVELAEGEPMALDDPGPCLVLCAAGSVTLDAVTLAPGHAAFLPAGSPTSLTGAGLVFVAAVGD